MFPLTILLKIKRVGKGTMPLLVADQQLKTSQSCWSGDRQRRREDLPYPIQRRGIITEDIFGEIELVIFAAPLSVRRGVGGEAS